MVIVADKKPRPQNKNLRPLNTIPEDEALEIRRKGARAATQRVRAKRQIQEIARDILSMGMHKGKVYNPGDGMSLDEAAEKNITVADAILVQELRKYFETGNTESRDFILSKAYPNGTPGVVIGVNGQPGEGQSGDGVRIHLIRGERPAASAAEDAEAAPPKDGS